MHTMTRVGAGIGAGLVFAVAASAQQITFTDTFEGQQNQGGWEFGETSAFIAPAGGNPGAYLHGEFYYYLPETETSEAATSPVFIGDYRARGVSAIGADANNFSVQYGVGGYPFVLLLETDNGTSEPSDDWAAFVRGDPIPYPGSGWKSFSFEVRSHATSMPPGWEVLGLGPPPPGLDWNVLIRNVTGVYFYFGDPNTVYLGYNAWTAGLDNLSITFDGCYPDCNADQSLTVGDFGCFQTKFVAADPYADCNGVGGLTVADFGCFQTRFVAGCP
jgi:hypothetical protein